jgi:hypothetical protein
MNRLLVLFALGAAGGCSAEPKPLAPATTPEASREALTAALDAWKQGKTRDDLARRSPPVYLLDDDFARGRKLADYRVEGDPKPVGTGLTYVVNLSFADGPPAARRLAYRVVTDPTISISREDRIP